MNKFLVFLAALIIGGGYYFYEDQKEKNFAKLICSEHFDTNDKSCLDEYWNYPFRLANKIAKKNFTEYKKKVEGIENKISELKYNLENFNALAYEPLTFSDLSLEEDYKKVIISHEDAGKFSDVSCRIAFDYQTCLVSKSYDYNNDQEVVNTEIVEITNIENFPEIKKILDELHSHNFRHYKIITYGDLKKGLMNSKIKADLIKLEKTNVQERVYESSLSTGIYIIKRKEFEEYFKNRFPKKPIPKLTNSVIYK